MDQNNFIKESAEKVSINWTIPSFQQYLETKDSTLPNTSTYISSHEISTNSSGVKWSLRLYPKGRTDPRFIDFSIICNGLTEDDELFAVSSGYFKSNCSGVNELRFKIPSRLSSRATTIDEKSRGWSTNKFLAINDLNEKQILINGQISITCDIYFLPKLSLSLKNQLISPIDFELFTDFLRITDYDQSNDQVYPSLFSQFTDFKILCYDDENKIQKVIPCHKAILMKKSTTFEAMLSHKSLLESTTNTISIDDFSYETVKAMVGFIYYGQIGKNKLLDEISSLLFIADKYNLAQLKTEAAKVLFNSHVNRENVIRCLSIAISSNCKYLESILCRLIRINWQHLSPEVNLDHVKSICPSFEVNPIAYNLGSYKNQDLPKRRVRTDSTGCQEEAYDSDMLS